MKKLTVMVAVAAMVFSLTSCDLLLTMIFDTNRAVAPLFLMQTYQDEQYIFISGTTVSDVYYDISASASTSPKPSRRYTGLIPVTTILSPSATTYRYIRAIAKQSGIMDSSVTTQKIRRAKSPVITYNSATKQMMFTVEAASWQVIYTTDGTTPSRSNGTRVDTRYSSVVTVPGTFKRNTSVKAIAFGDDAYFIADSPVAEKIL